MHVSSPVVQASLSAAVQLLKQASAECTELSKGVEEAEREARKERRECDVLRLQIQVLLSLPFIKILSPLCQDLSSSPCKKRVARGPCTAHQLKKTCFVVLKFVLALTGRNEAKGRSAAFVVPQHISQQSNLEGVSHCLPGCALCTPTSAAVLLTIVGVLLSALMLNILTG